MHCPHHSSTQQLADVIVGTRTCPFAEDGACDPMRCVDSLRAEELRPFFKDLLPESFRKRQAANQLPLEELEWEVRAKLGVWYATSFLTSFYTGDHASPLQARMRALAREALQWHQDSFLTHVLVYFRSPETENVQHYTTVIKSSDTTKERFVTFLDSLQDYVNTRGTTVRTDAHLKRVIVGQDRATPIRPVKIIYDELEKFDFLRLPADRTFSGSEEKYGEILKLHFQQEHPPTNSNGMYGQLHLAAGCDTQYMDETQSIGAVAHMYIVFRGPVPEDHTFNHSMRAMLSRLAMSFSLEEMQRKAEEFRTLADSERRRNERLFDHVKSLNKAIYEVEEASRGVRSMVKREVWDILREWTIVLADLFTTNKELRICKLPITGEHNYWGKNHFAAALLYLVSATDRDETSRMTSITDKWEYYRTTVYANESGDNPIWRCLKRSGMLNSDTLDNMTRDRKNRNNLVRVWKDGLSKVEADPSWGSIFLLLLAVGARPGKNTEKLERKFKLNRALEFGVVASGLNKCFEAMLEYNATSTDGGPADAAEIRLTRESEVSIDIQLADDQLHVLLSPVRVAEQDEKEVTEKEVSVISAEGFAKVCERVGELAKLERAVEGRNDTSTGIILALGVDQNKWAETVRHLHVSPQQQSIELRDHGQTVSRATFVDGELRLSYKLTRDKSQNR